MYLINNLWPGGLSFPSSFGMRGRLFSNFTLPRKKKSAWLQVMYSTFFNLIHESPYPDMGALKLAPTIFGSKWLPHENLTPEKLIITWGEVTAAMKRKPQPRYWKYHYKPQYMVLFACTEERILSSLQCSEMLFLIFAKFWSHRSG